MLVMDIMKKKRGVMIYGVAAVVGTGNGATVYLP